MMTQSAMKASVSGELMAGGARLQQIVKGECPRHGHFESMVFNVGGQSFGGTCPKCTLIESDKAFARAQQDRRSLVNQNSMEQRMATSGIPDRHLQASLTGFREDWNQDRAAHAASAAHFVASWADSSRAAPWLVLFGNTGSGKTYLSAAIAREIAARYRSNIRFIRSSDIARTINDTYRDNSSMRETMGRLSRFNGLLIVDELGWQSGSDNDRMMTAEVIASRYEEDLPLIITTNLMPNEVCSFLGEQVFDRLRDKAEFLHFEGGSVRGYLRGLNHGG